MRSRWSHSGVRPSADERRAGDDHARVERPVGAEAGSRFRGTRLRRPLAGRSGHSVGAPHRECTVRGSRCRKPSSAVPAGQGGHWSALTKRGQAKPIEPMPEFSGACSRGPEGDEREAASKGLRPHGGGGDEAPRRDELKLRLSEPAVNEVVLLRYGPGWSSEPIA